jgi:hypothetical protein
MRNEYVCTADYETQAAPIRFGTAAVFAMFFRSEPQLQRALLDQPAKDFLAPFSTPQ